VVLAGARSSREESLTFRVRLDPLEEWHGEVDVQVTTAQPATAPRPTQARLETDWDDLQRTYRRSLDDLAALRFNPDAVRAPRCRPPACPGSWRFSAGTA
jgi:hypothetical protein